MRFRPFGLAPTLASIILLTTGLVALVLDRVAEGWLEDELTREFESKGEAIALSLAFALASNTRDTLAGSLPGIQEAIDSGRTIEGVSYIYIQDWEGSILVHTFVPTFPPTYVEMNWIEAGSLPAEARVRIARDRKIETLSGMIDAIDVAAPISRGDLGVVHVGMNQAFISGQVAGLRRSMAILSIAIALLGVALGLTFAFVAVVRPIRALRVAALDIVRTGDLSQELTVRAQGEVGDLIGSFNRMIIDLRRSREEVAESNRTLAKRCDDLQRANTDLALKQDELDNKNRELIRASQAKSQFLASMSHELRTPMNSIIGFTDLILTKSSGIEPRHRANLERVLGNGHHLLALINNVLDLSKVEAGKMELASEAVDLRAVCDQSATTAEVLLAGKSVRLVREISPLPPMRGDNTRLRQIVLNLLSNACKFTDQGEVKITATASENSVVISVSDTGTGISSEDVDTLFEEFRQVGNHRAKSAGTGLGLAISKHMVELMGGSIQVESRLGAGSTFTVRFPVEAGAAVRAVPSARRLPEDETPLAKVPAASPRRKTLPPLSRKTALLIVTDDPVAAVAVRDALTGRPYETEVAFSIEGALALAASMRPAAILVRMTADDDFGWRALWAFKADEVVSRIPAIMISVVDGRPLALRNAATEYLCKPLERIALLSAVERLGGREILVVDDDPAVHDLLHEVLSFAGFQVRHANGGEAAIAVCGAEPPDLVVLDLMMPDVDGFDVLHALRSRPSTARLPVVVLTNKELSPIEARALGYMVERIFQKASFTGDALVRELENVLDELT